MFSDSFQLDAAVGRMKLIMMVLAGVGCVALGVAKGVDWGATSYLFRWILQYHLRNPLCNNRLRILYSKSQCFGLLKYYLLK